VVKCSEVLQCIDGLSNKVSNIIRRHIDNMKLLIIYSLGSISYQYIYIYIHMVVFLFNTVIYVFLLLCLCSFIVCLCIFIVPATPTEGYPCFFL